jgi:hypothetical protein
VLGRARLNFRCCEPFTTFAGCKPGAGMCGAVAPQPWRLCSGP